MTEWVDWSRDVAMIAVSLGLAAMFLLIFAVFVAGAVFALIRLARDWS